MSTIKEGMGGQALVPARSEWWRVGGLQRGRTGTRLVRTHSFELDNCHGKKDAPSAISFFDNSPA